MADIWTILGVSSSVISTTTTVFAVLYARSQITAAAALSKVQFIDSLEREFASLMATQARLRKGGRWENPPGATTEAELVELEVLLSFYEKLCFVKETVVDFDSLDDQFGTRFIEATSNGNVERFLEQTGGAGSWPALYRLKDQWRVATTRRLP